MRLIFTLACLFVLAAGLVLLTRWHHDPGWMKAAAVWFVLGGYLGTAFCEPWKIRLRG